MVRNLRKKMKAIKEGIQKEITEWMRGDDNGREEGCEVAQMSKLRSKT